MVKKRFPCSEAKVGRWIKKGRGQCIGSAYKLRLTDHDVPSEGGSHRVLVA